MCLYYSYGSFWIRVIVAQCQDIDTRDVLQYTISTQFRVLDCPIFWHAYILCDHWLGYPLCLIRMIEYLHSKFEIGWRHDAMFHHQVAPIKRDVIGHILSNMTFYYFFIIEYPSKDIFDSKKVESMCLVLDYSCGWCVTFLMSIQTYDLGHPMARGSLLSSNDGLPLWRLTLWYVWAYSDIDIHFFHHCTRDYSFSIT